MENTRHLQDAILKTLCYADVFEYPLTDEELHRYLIASRKISAPDGKTALEKLYNQGLIGEKQGLYFLRGRASLVAKRIRRKEIAGKSLTIARRVGNWLKRIPTIKMVAVTGTLAMENTEESDDIDLMIITQRNRLWLTRGIAVPLISLIAKRRKPELTPTLPALGKSNRPTAGRTEPGGEARSLREASEKRKWRRALCLNLFLDETSLRLPKKRRNLYSAHEVVQALPLWSRNETREKFLRENAWILDFLPNTKIPYHPGQAANLNGTPLPSGNNQPGSLLENYAYQIQLQHMRPKRTRELVLPNAAYFHPRNTARLVLDEYQKRLNRFHLM